MLVSVELENFLIHKALRIDFPDRGLTTITGKNATGKSTVLMAIRFALFGSAALNGKVEDVKGGRVRLVFALRDQTYAVERRGGAATISKIDGTVLATGTKPVNTKVVELLGFGLSVFDAACCATQGAIEALSAMRPSERKRLVDDTLGLAALDDIAEWCGVEANARAREIDAIQRNLISVPEEPVPPSEPMEGLGGRLKKLQEDVKLYWRLKSRLEDEPLVTPAPDWTKLPPGLPPVAEMRSVNQAYTALERRLTKLNEQLSGLPTTPPQHTTDDAEALRQYLDAKDVTDAFKRPDISLEELEEEEAKAERRARWEQWHKLKRKGSHRCPKCEHTWAVAAAEMEKLDDGFTDEPPPEPSLSSASRQAARTRHNEVAENWAEIEGATATLVRLTLTKPHLRPLFGLNRQLPRMIERAWMEWGKVQDLQTERVSLASQMVNTPRFDDSLIYMAGKLQAEQDEHDVTLQRHAKWKEQADAARAKLPELEGAQERLEALQGLQAAWAVYQGAKGSYDRQRAAREAQDADLAGLVEEAGVWRRAREAVLAVRTRVKGHLVPSLSAASGVLVARMTGGARRDVRVTEDFEITVDGQPVETLSGSEKAAANLALRVALGQVLTARVFPVFLADEPDAAMDPERAAMTSDTLRSLDQNLAQIVLVTHKEHDADLVVKLGAN